MKNVSLLVTNGMDSQCLIARWIVLTLFFLVLGGCTGTTSRVNSQMNTVTVPYQADWESLKRYSVPDWFRDAKLGIFIHWGAYSVPAYGSEWYPRNMYMDEHVYNAEFEMTSHTPSREYLHHIEKYGSLAEFGYKDFIPMFKGEHFDAARWMDLFVQAGAKYVVPVAEHHDAFAMYHSQHTRWNAVEMGPKRDVLGELFEAGRQRGLKVGASSHYAFNWSYFQRKPTFDNWDHQHDDLYGYNREKNDHMDEAHLSRWWNRTTDIIDQYEPDILWFDFYWDKEVFRPYHKKLAAYYYNQGIRWKKGVVLQGKNFGGFESFPDGTFLYDLERGKLSDIKKEPWQTDTSIGANSWGYVSNWISKTPNKLIDDLVDIVSKNGCLLLNVGPKADGTIPVDQQEVLLEIGAWLKVNGGAIYGSRPWRIFGEGPTAVAVGHHSEGKNKDFTAQDFRFTTNGDKLYAIAMDWSTEGTMNIKSLAHGSENCPWQIKEIRLLGLDDELEWHQDKEALTIHIPASKPGDHAFVFEVDFGEHSREATRNAWD